MGRWRGVFVALATPFSPDGENVDEDALRHLVDRMIADGIHGIITTGNTGECYSMSMSERRAVLEIVLDQTRGRIPVLAHTASLATRDAVALSRHAQGTSAAGLMLIGPSYKHVSEQEIYTHYATIAASVDLPIMIYNNPSATGYSLQPEFIAHLSRSIDTIQYVKDSTGDMGRIHRLMQLCDDAIGVFNGADTVAFAAFAAGIDGAVWGAANATPRQCVDLFEALVVQNDLMRGRDMWRTLYPVNRFFEEEGYVASVKAATTLQGISIGAPRPPLLPLSPPKLEELERMLEVAGLAR